MTTPGLKFGNILIVAAIAAITIALVWRITALRGFVFGPPTPPAP